MKRKNKKILNTVVASGVGFLASRIITSQIAAGANPNIVNGAKLVAGFIGATSTKGHLQNASIGVAADGFVGGLETFVVPMLTGGGNVSGFLHGGNRIGRFSPYVNKPHVAGNGVPSIQVD